MSWPLKDQWGEKNHNWKGGCYFIRGRRIVKANGCSRCFSNGYAQEHLVIAEMALGKPLPKSAVVHHIDGNKANNINSNLVVCEDDAYHRHLHKRTRALKACGHANWIKCTLCKQYDEPKNLYIRPNDGIGNHRLCRREKYHNNKIKKESKE